MSREAGRKVVGRQMKIRFHHRYEMRAYPGAKYKVVAPNGKRHFIAPASKVGGKIYLVAEGGALHYVGYTNRPMSQRLRMGLKAKGKNGYYGYAWKKCRAPLTLDVLTWTRGSRKDLESVEAEVVFLYRLRHGSWPMSQTEIHFRPPEAKHAYAAKAVLRAFEAANTPHELRKHSPG